MIRIRSVFMRLLTVSLLLIVVTIITAVPVNSKDTPPPVEPTPTLNLSPNTGVEGQLVTVHGGGYTGGPISIYFNDTFIEDVYVSAEGLLFEYVGSTSMTTDPTFTVPSVPSGSSYSVETREGATVLASTSFTVEIVETVSPPSTCGPNYGPIPTNTIWGFSTAGANSNMGHTIEYRFDWGDGTFSDWVVFVCDHTQASDCDPVIVTNSWSNEGDYTLRAQARCFMHPDIISDWLEGVEINIVNPQITVEPASGLAGSEINITGTGFGLGAGHITIGAEGYDDEEPVNSFDTEGTGNFSVDSTVPPSLPPGSYTIQAGYGLYNATAAYTVEAPITEPPQVTTSAATNIGTSTATLNGTLVQTGSYDGWVSVDFEWDTDSGE
ncbi:MAG: hypothetical protein GY845_33180, partial [Planctomycetes bacterium]|nr:hypothetical protein [Planctomycetota bacterium]